MEQTKDVTKTILTITVGLLFVYFITKLNWLQYVAFCVGLTGLLSSYLSNKISFYWMKLAWLLSLIVPTIILSLIFFLILTPIAFFSRMLGKKDALCIKKPLTESMFRKSSINIDKLFFEKTW